MDRSPFLQVSRFVDPQDACSAIAAESYKLWLEHENRTDDITIIVVQIKDMVASYAEATNETIHTSNSIPLSPAKVKAQRRIVSQSDTNHPIKGSCQELQSGPPDSSANFSPAYVARSPTHSVHLKEINPD